MVIPCYIKRPCSDTFFFFLVNGVSCVLQNYLRYFGGIIISTSFVRSFPVSSCIFSLNLNKMLLLSATKSKALLVPSIYLFTKGNRKRDFIWFNTPFSANVKTKVGNYFLNLIRKHFPLHKFCKICIRNTNKIS